ncbi:diguanylate cyclase [Thioalkalicoccus limnaeus]|uniref:Diguanylate cyclase n=1 Tax=Thioalkalicoccus limnaeus TaxID=120681 RepID=A0ABV4BA43_9GAMM
MSGAQNEARIRTKANRDLPSTGRRRLTAGEGFALGLAVIASSAAAQPFGDPAGLPVAWFTGVAGILLALVAAFALFNRGARGRPVARSGRRHEGFDQGLARLAVGFVNPPGERQADALAQALMLACELSGGDRAHLWRFDEEQGLAQCTEQWSRGGIDPVERPSEVTIRDRSPAWLAKLGAGEVIAMPRASADSKYSGLVRALVAERKPRSLLVVPLIVAGRLIGWIGIEAVRRMRRWSDDEAVHLGNLASLLAAVSERDRIAAERTTTELRYREAIEDIREVVFQTDADGHWTFLNSAWERITGFSVADTLGQSALDFMHDVDRRFGWISLRTLIRREVDQFRYQLRFVTRDGRERWLEANVRLRLGPDGQVLGLRGTLMDVTERKAADEEIHKLAFFDALTGLPNRRLLLDRLQQTLASSGRSGQYGAILFIDLDNFKVLNDTHGHHMGDLLLKQVAGRLQGCVRRNDTVARLGGDEFVVMLTQLSAEAEQAAIQVGIVGEKIRAALGLPYDLAGLDHRSTPSIGATLFVDHTLSIEELLKRADVAMYEAKAAGRNALRFAEPAS